MSLQGTSSTSAFFVIVAASRCGQSHTKRSFECIGLFLMYGGDSEAPMTVSEYLMGTVERPQAA